MTEDWLSNLPRVEGAASPELRAESLKRLRQQLLQMLSKELPLFFDELDEILFAASSSDNSPQNQFDYFQAMGKLRKSKRETLPRIIDAFKERYDQLILINEDVPATRRGGSVELEVLDEDVLEDMIALDNLVSRAVDASQPTLAYLTRRLEYLVGWAVSLSDNPFIPEAICESFLAQLTKIAITQAARNTCVEQFSKWLHRVWPQVVADCNRTLVSLDVLPSLETSKKTIKKTATRNPATDKTTGSPSEQPRKASSDNAEGSGIPTQSTAGQTQKPESPSLHTGSASATEESYINEVLQRWLGTQSRRPLSERSGSRRELEGSLKTLLDVKQCLAREPDTKPLHEALTSEGLEAVLSDVMARQDKSMAALDALSKTIIRVLDQSFGRLVKQQLSPAELKSLILDMEIPTACLAVQDPSFLDRNTHPARRLINEIYNVSSSFLDGADQKGDPLRKKVDDVIRQLSSIELSLKQITGLLTDFIDFVEKDKRQQSVREQRLFEEEEAKAKTNQSHTLVVNALGARLGDELWPEVVLSFCEKAWCKVLFLTSIRKGVEGDDWALGLESLDRLLMLASSPGVPDVEKWSLLQEDLIGELLQIGYDRQLAAQLFRGISQLFDTGRVELSLRGNNAEPAEKRLFDRQQVDLPGEWLAPESLQQDDEDILALQAVDRLKRGAWLEFQGAEGFEPQRCKYAGVVKINGSYIFTNRKGIKVRDTNRYELAHLLQSGQARVLDNSHLFDTAYEQTLEHLRSQIQSTAAGSLH